MLVSSTGGTTPQFEPLRYVPGRDSCTFSRCWIWAGEIVNLEQPPKMPGAGYRPVGGPIQAQVPPGAKWFGAQNRARVLYCTLSSPHFNPCFRTRIHRQGSNSYGELVAFWSLAGLERAPRLACKLRHEGPTIRGAELFCDMMMGVRPDASCWWACRARS